MQFESKKDFTDWMLSVLEPIKPHYSQGCARLHIGETGVTYPQVSIEMEAFSRPLWALAPFWMGGGQGFEEIYVKGIENGTNPSHSEFWGGFSDYDQRFVEMAAIASAMIFTPEKIWEPLTLDGRERLAAWLYEINKYIIPECNWQFFMVLVNVALKKMGCKYSEEKMKSGLDKLDSYYLSDGWYRDGASNQKDYYVSFAMHYYGLLYAVALEKEDPKRSQCYKERAELFAKDFIYWFDENGAAVPYGRSLTYRFAEAAFWSAYVFAGLREIPLGIVKGIISRHFSWWNQHKMFDRDGILTIGYAYPNLLMAERYNAPGSPYWGLKTLLCLALPDEHPFWTAPAEAMPHLLDIKPIKQADMLMHRLGKDVILYPAGDCEKIGHGNVSEKYSKFAYSTRFGFSVAKSQIHLHENAPDSMLAFSLQDDMYIFVRKSCIYYKIEEDHVISTWSPLPGIQVTTTIIPKAYGHLRIHEIESDFNCKAYDCGFAVDIFTEGYQQTIENKKAQVLNNKIGCSVSGDGPGAEGTIIPAFPNTNILYTNTSIPAAAYRITKDEKIRIETKVECFIF